MTMKTGMKPMIDPAVADLLGEPMKPQAMFGGYDGADALDRTLALWSPPSGSADAIVLPSKALAEGRVRDLARNDAYVAAGMEFHRDSVVGSKFRFVSEPKYNLLGLSETWADEFSEELEARWEAWAESEECYADASRRLTFTGMVRLAVLSYVMHQEVLATVEWMRDRRRPTRTAIQLIDPDRMRNPNTATLGIGALLGDPLIRGGIEMKPSGEHVAYWIHQESAVDSLLYGRYEAKRIAARKPWGRRQVIHIGEPTRIGQTRGISQLVTSLRETKIGRKYRDIVLQNAVVNATYAATIESELPRDQIYQMFGTGGQVDPTEVIEQYIASMLNITGDYVEGSKRLRMEGAKIPILPPGTKLNLQRHDSAGGIGDDFESSILRYTAASLGTTYEELTRDLRETNYSSIKAGMNLTNRTMRARKSMVADRFANQACAVWFEEEFNNNRFETIRPGMPGLYDPQMPYAMQWYLNASWFGTGMGQVDELKETQAMHQRIINGTSSLKIEIARLHGLDWRDVLRQRKREQQFIEENGIEVGSPDKGMDNATTGNANGAGDGGNGE